MPRTIKYIDLFAGVGGFHYGLCQVSVRDRKTKQEKVEPKTSKQGVSNAKKGSLYKWNKPDNSSRRVTGKVFNCVYSNEWDKYANSVYRRHYEKCDNRDIKTVKSDEIPDHDLLCAGFPCQSFSIAGKRKGFEDTRGTLFYEIARIVKHKRPRYLLLENVKGLLSHDKGKTYQTMLRVLSDLGYRVEWQVLNSVHFGVPQNRERIFIVGHLGEKGRPQIFPLRESIRGTKQGIHETQIVGALSGGGHSGGHHSSMTLLKEVTKNVSDAQRVYDSKGIAKTLKGLGGGLGAKTGLYAVRWSRTEKGREARRKSKKTLGRDYTPFNKGHRKLVRSKEQVSGCVTHAINKDSLLEHDMKIRRLTPIECSLLQGFPPNWTKHGIVDATPVMYNKGYADAKKENASKILRVLRKAISEDKGKRRRLAESIALFEKEILQPQLYAKRLQGSLEKGESFASSGELQSNAVDSCDRMFEVWQKEKPRYTPQRQKQIEQRLEELRSIVSKLPHEIAQKGRWVESSKKKQGKRRQICFNWISDTQRYKQMGNAVTTNVIEAIGKKMLEVI